MTQTPFDPFGATPPGSGLQPSNAPAGTEGPWATGPAVTAADPFGAPEVFHQVSDGAVTGGHDDQASPSIDADAAPPGSAVTPRRGRRLAVVACAGAALATIAMGIGIYEALASIDVISLDPAKTALTWSFVAVGGVVVSVVAAVLIVAALIRSRGRAPVAWIALVVILVGPPVALVVGAQLGVTALYKSTKNDIKNGGTAAADVIDDWGADHGVDLGPLLDWVEASE